MSTPLTNPHSYVPRENKEWLKRLTLVLSLSLLYGLAVAQRPNVDYWNIPTLQITPVGYPFRYRMPEYTFHAMPNSTLSAAGIPPGLSFTDDLHTGLSFTDYSINGTPTTVGEYPQVEVIVTTPYGEDSGARVPIDVVATPRIPAQQVSVDSLFSYTIPYSAFPNYNVDDRPDEIYRFGLSGLPPGLRQVNRSITGSANKPGVYMVQATLYNGSGIDIAIYFPLTVKPKSNTNPCQTVACIPLIITRTK